MNAPAQDDNKAIPDRPSELDTFIAAHVAALAEYDAVPDAEWDSPRGHALDRVMHEKRKSTAVIGPYPIFVNASGQRSVHFSP